MLALGGWGLFHTNQAAQTMTVTVVSAASYDARAIAPESIVAAFGQKLASQIAFATDDDPNTAGIQLPTTLGGARVEINGRRAELFYVSPTQINFLTAPETPIGSASVVVRDGENVTATGTMTVSPVAPAIFTANSDGRGVAAAQLLRVKTDNTQRYELAADFDALANRFIPRPINLGPMGERAFLVCFLSGLRRANDPNGDGNLTETVQVVIGGQTLVPQFAGRQADFAGLDQINIELPHSLVGRDLLDFKVTVDAAADSNTAQIKLAPAAGEFPPPEASNRSPRIFEDESAVIKLVANDPGGRPLRYIITSLPRHGKLCAATTVDCAAPEPPDIRYVPDANYNQGDEFKFKVSNGIDDSLSATIKILMIAVNDPPTLSVPGAQSFAAGEKVSFIVTAADPDLSEGQTLSFSIVSPQQLPPLVRLDATSYRFNWTPTVLDAGRVYPVVIKVEDNVAPTMSDIEIVPITVGIVWAKTSGPESGNINTLFINGAQLYAGTVEGGVFFSNDRGLQWTAINGNLGLLSTTQDLASLSINALLKRGGRLLAAARDGLYISDDNGQNWSQTNVRGVNVLSLVESGATLCAGTLSAGALVSTDDGRTWRATSSADFEGHNLIYALVARGGKIFAGLSDTFLLGDGGIFASVNDGQNWKRLTDGLPQGGRVSVTALAANATHLFAATEQGVYVSADDGKSWNSANTGLPNDRILALARVGETIYLSAAPLIFGEAGRLFSSTNNGQNWAPVNSSFTTRLVPALAGNETELYAGTGGDGVFISRNGGQSWIEINAGFTNSSVVAFAHDEAGAQLFAATDRAIFSTTNKGAVWKVANAQLPRDTNGDLLSVRALAARGGEIFAGTGKGVFVAPLSGSGWTAINSGLTNMNVTALALSDGRLLVATGGGVFAFDAQARSWRAASQGLISLQVNALVLSGANLYATTDTGVFVSNNQGRVGCGWARRLRPSVCWL